MIETYRPEDRNATEQFRTFSPDGATLAELEEAIRMLRERGAPDDAHPRIKTNEHGEAVGLVCVTERAEAWRQGVGLTGRPLSEAVHCNPRTLPPRL